MGKRDDKGDVRVIPDVLGLPITCQGYQVERELLFGWGDAVDDSRGMRPPLWSHGANDAVGSLA